MIIFQNQFLAFISLIPFCKCISNLQLRGCIDDATNEDNGQCYSQLLYCFSIQECNDEFSLLFHDCQLPLDDRDFDIECFKQGKKRIQNNMNKELAQCFDEVCGMFGAQPTSDLDYIQTKIIENLQKQKEKYENKKQKREMEEFICVKNALNDSDKCYQHADFCDEECRADLFKLKNCYGEYGEDCIYDIQGGIQNLSNLNSIQLIQCLSQYCYENKKYSSQAQFQNELTNFSHPEDL